MSPTSPLRHGNQQATMSAKTKRLLGFYEDELHVRYGERTISEYRSHVKAFSGWLSAQSIELPDVRTEDLQTYQNELLGQKRKDGKPYSLSYHHYRLTVVKSLVPVPLPPRVHPARPLEIARVQGPGEQTPSGDPDRERNARPHRLGG